MKFYIFIIIILLSFVNEAYSELIEIKQDNGLATGHSYVSRRNNWEEGVSFKINAPCYVKKIKVYFYGENAVVDTIYVCGDPPAGNLYPTMYVLPQNSLIPAIIFNYDGKQGWREFDISQYNLRLSGFEAVAILHRMKSSGPWFAYDSDGRTTGRTSWLTDPITPNSQFYNIKGTLYEFPSGDFLVRLLIEYEFPDGNISALPPAPTLVNINSTAKVSFSGYTSIADWNNDGWDDISSGGYFYLNNQDGTFTNKTSEFAIPSGGYSWGDFDNDGKIDLFVARGWANDKFYKNTGNGFLDVTDNFDFVNNYPTETPVWLDYDSDGFLDLFIANRRSESGGQEQYYPNQLWRSTGNNFVNVTTTSGISAGEPYPYYDLYGACAVDYNLDNFSDIFVATYRLAPDLLYRNNKQGGFTEVGAQTGARGIPTASSSYFGHGMGCHWGDFNNDGYIDLCVGNLAHLDERGIYSNPSLILKNQGPPNYNFIEVGKQMGLRFHEGNAGTIWLDLDLDGYLDLWHGKYAGGVGSFYINQGPPDYKLKDVTWELGAVVQNPWVAVFSDLDNDGDLDVIMNGIVFRNDIERKGNWIAFRLQGNPNDKVNMDAYGTKVYVFCKDKMFYRELSGSASGSRSAQNTNELHFGIGNYDKVDSVKIIYPNGKSFVYNNIDANARYFIPYGRPPEMKILSTPALKSPKNYQINVNEIPTFSWNKLGGAERYRIQVSTSVDFKENLMEFNNIINTNFAGFNLEKEKMYYWRVKAYNDNYESQWSSVWCFYTDIPKPSKPQLLEPANNSENLPIKPTFSWSPASLPISYGSRLTYKLQVALDNNFTNIIFDISNIRDTFFVAEENLNVNTTYYWRVFATNFDKNSEPSETYLFKTISAPAVPILNSPKNNDTNINVRPFFRWDAVAFADFYHIQISNDEQFESIYIEKDSINVSLYKPTKNLEPSTYYYWRVRACNIAGYGNWSETWVFKTQEGSSSIEFEEELIKNKYYDLNFYPNPFSDVLNINFNIKIEKTYLAVSIYDVFGEELVELCSDYLNIGNYTFKWTPQNISPGIYFVKIRSNNFEKLFKVIYLK